MVAMLLVVADAADDTLLDALGLQADEVQHFPDVVFAPRALRVTKLRAFRHIRQQDGIIISKPVRYQ